MVSYSIHSPYVEHDVNYYYPLIDATVLNFALTLEHLENAFYSGALAKYDANAFTAAGLPAFARQRFVEVGEHEQVCRVIISSCY